MSEKALTDRLAALSPAQRALLEQALRAKEAKEQKETPRPRPVGTSATALRTVPKRETYSPVPLSIDQERLWFIQQLDPSSPVYNIYNAIRFRGPLDIGVLTAAFQEVVRRQEVLRTAFPAVDGQPVQVIVPHVELVLPEVDLRGLPEEVREAEAERVAEAVVRRPFALDRLPLFNFPLIRLEDEDLVQPSIFHHIIVDRLSAEIMTTEIRAVYAAFLQGQPSPLPELHIQFADFAVWQRRRLEDEAFRAELVGWWERHLDGAPELLAMPLDRPRPPVQGPDGSRRRLHLSRAHSDGLRALAQSESMTLFIAGVALLQTLLVRWTNQEKLIVGTPYDYRQGPDLEPLMGFFLNQLVLYTDLSGNPTFREAMARVRETALGAYAHHDLPFAKLVEYLKPERDLSRIPYTQVVFLLLPLPAHATPGVSQGRADVDEIAMDGFWVDARRTQFDINFALWEEEDGRLAGFIEHSTDLFDVSTIDRMRELFRNLLATVLFEPDRRIWDVPLLSEAQAQQLVREWNPREEVEESRCLHELFEEQVRRAPDAPAVSFEGRTLSYAELDREANRLAWRLVESGVAPGSRVGLSAQRGVELVAGILGILKAGCAYVPLDPEYPQERLEYLIEDSGVALVVGPNWEGGSAETAPAVPVDPDAPAYVIYTSGSTGKPKGVVVTHRNVARLLASTRRWFDFGPSDVWTLFHSYAFDFSVWEIWGALAFGGRLVVVPFWVSRSPEVFHAVLANERVTVLNQTPSAFRQLLALEKAAHLPALRWVIFGGEALEPQSLLPWWERYGDERPGLVNMYGITEITVHATFRRVRREDSEPGKGSRIGVPLPDLSIHVLDPAGRPAPIGVSGELCVGGDGVALGYLNRPALTAERFIPDAYGPTPGGRLYRSGDLARWIASGELEYQGRIDHQVKVRGFRIELGEIEAALGQHSGLRDAVVIARGDGGATRLLAYVVPLDGMPPTVEELRSHLRERLPEYMVPAVFVTLEALPLTPTGKVDRKGLPEPDRLGRAELGTEYAAPQTAAEEALARVWAEVLRVERVGRHDNFFALGGDSILSLRVVALAGQQGLKLALPDLFRFQTVAELAAQVGGLEGETEAPVHTEPFSLISAEDRARLPEDAVDAYPLAALQAGMMYHMVLRPEDPPYHNVDSWHLKGPFEPAPFQEAVDRVVRRHPILRTSFDLTGYGEPIQIVHREARLPVVVEDDLSPLSDEEQEAAVDALIAREKRRLHDFTRPPQLRIHIQLRSGGTFQLTLTENHAIFDGWSLHATLAEIFETYLDLLDGKDLPEPAPVPLSYRDFVALEREAIASPEATAYWERVLADRPTDPLPHWPSWPKPAVWPRIRGVVLTVPRPVFHGLKDLARAAGVPFKSVLLASHFAAQSRLTGNPDVITGVVSNGRLEEAAGDQVRGLFLNTLPLRVRIPAGSWLDLARETARSEQEMLPFRRVPFAALQRRAGGEAPLFRMPFNYIHFHAVRDLLRTGRVEMIEFKRAEGSNFEITANYSQALEGVELGGEMEYDSQVWAREEVEAIVDLYSRVLEAMASNPEAPCLGQALLSAPQRHQILYEWNDTASGREPVLAYELFAAQAERTPDAPAVVHGDLSLTYAELRGRAGRLARHLAALGVAPEAPVAVCVERSPDWAAAMLGVLAAGGVYLPLDPAYPDARLQFLLRDSGAGLVVTQTALRERLPVGLGILEIDGLDGDPAPSLSASGLGPDRAAYVIYTSGSTGQPKGVVVEHRALSLFLQEHAARLGLGPGDRVSLTSALSFDASLMDLLGTLIAGGTCVLFDRRPALDLDRLLESLGELTVIHAVPALARQIARAARERGTWPGLRHFLLGGDATPPGLPAELRLAFPQARIDSPYGPTEATVYCSHETWDEAAMPPSPLPTAGSPLGRPTGDAETLLLGAHGLPVPVGVTGEIHIGGPVLARGYLGRPDLTAERFGPVPGSGGRRFYRTGDLARRLPDGRLEFLGRSDAQVKVRGFRIEPGEIEAALVQHPGVREAAVVARKEGDAQRLIACLVARSDDLSLTDLRAFLRDRLPDYLVPSAFLVLPELPLSPAGKVDRLALSRLEPGAAGGGERRSAPYQAPRTPVEEAVTSLWADALGVPRVGVQDDFFELGGDSLLATRVMSRLRSALGVEVRLATLFERPTVAALAPAVEGALQAGRAAPAPPLVPRPERGAAAPLSFAQQRLWFLDRMEPGGTAYNMPLAVRLQGDLDEAALEEALAAIVERHEALRTVFAEIPDGPVQLAVPTAGFFLPRVDLTALGVRAEDEARRLVDDDARRPFDLESGPLFRPALLRLSEGDAVLLGGMHHIVSDGWSTGVLLGELSALYSGTPLPELPVQYADFAVWQRRWLSGDVLEAELSYWREHLRGLPAQLELPFDRPRPAVRRGRGATRPFALPAETAAGLRALARSEGMTLFMVLLAGAEALLSRLANQEDFGIGTPIAGRNRLETEGLIGFFVNTLVLRSGTAGDPAFRVLLGRAREETLAAYAHQDLPFEKLVEELAPERSLAHTPLFQVLFTLQGLQGQQGQGSGLPGLTLSRFGAEETHAKFDLTLALGEDLTGLTGGIEYDRDLFDAATIDRWLVHLGTLLAAAVREPERRLSELPLLTAEERRQILEGWNANDVPYPRERSLADLFEEQAALRPQAPALVWPGSEWSYAALDAAADQLAGRLLALGVGPEVRVALCLPRTPAMVIATLAVVKAGGAYVPLDPEHPAERLAWMLEDAGAAVVVGESEWIAGPGSELPRSSRLFVPVDGPPSAQRNLRPAHPGGGALAYVMYTSGSTGRPKGVMVPQSAVIRLVRGTDYVPFSAEDRVALISNPVFDAATFEVWGALLNGGCLVGVEQHDLLEPRRLAQALRDQGVTAMFLTAALFHQTVREEPAAFATVRHLLVGGDAVDPRRARECLEVGAPERLLNGYGPTETTTFAAWHEIREVPAGSTVVPVGGPLRNARLHVLRGNEPVPFGVHGELCIGGEGLARGYLERPDLTAERFVPDPFGPSGERLYRTGDLARRRDDGLVEVLGRMDRQVKIRGFRVEPGEVEAALAAHPSVREAAVVVRSEDGDKRLVGYVAGDVDPLELRRFLEERLPEPMVPAVLIPLPELPLTPTGKVDRLALAGRSLEMGSAAGAAAVDPRDPVEETVAAIWAEVLHRERVGVYDDFFDLGGHSLLATQVLSRLRQTLGIELDLRSLFESPTVAGLSEAVREELRGDSLPAAPPLVPSGETGPAPLSFAQQRLWFLDRLEPGSTAYNVPLAVRLRGELDVPALAASLGAIVDRHDTLRTTFAIENGQPVQIVAPPSSAPFEPPFEDLSGFGPDAESEARRRAEEAGGRVFDLARGPLFAPLLLRLAPDDHVLAFAMHHIVSDGWSIGVFVRELGSLYRGDAPLEPLPVQYADFARWQRGWLSGEALEAELSYWRRSLAGLPPQLELPFDRPRPAVRAAEAAYLPLVLDGEETAALRRLAREEGATLFMTLLAGLQAVLARWSGQEDFALGTPIAGRNRVEIEGLIGFFVNTLVLRAGLGGDPVFRDLLGRARRETLGAFTHQDLPFEKLVEELAPERDLSHTPLFQVMCALQNAPVGALELPGLALEPFPLAGASAKFDLTLSLMESGDGLSGSLEYDRGLFDEATAARLLSHLRTLWAGAAADPGLRLAELPLVSEAELRQAILDGGPADLAGKPVFVHSRFEEQAARRPEAVAIVSEDGSWTYGELAARSAALAARLRGVGVGPEVRVGVCARRTPALIAGLLGVLRAGGAYVPLDPAYPRERLAWILEDSAPACILVGEGAAEALPERHGLPLLPLEMDGAAPAPALDDLDPDNLAYLIYTSGSTGRPKAVAVTHRTSAALIEWCGETFSAEELSGVLASSSVSFDLSIFELYAPLSWGGRMILARDLLAVPTLTAASEVTLINTVPTAMAELVRSGGVPGGVRTVMTGGELLPRELAEAILALPSRPRLYNMYGPSEDTTFSTIRAIESGEGELPLGGPLPGTQALILDRWGALAPPGLPGDLHLGGLGLARGYLGRPDLTADRYGPDPFSGEPGARLYRTGDRMRLGDRHGAGLELEFRGRLDNQVKVRGFRVEPGEVEAALLRHPEVREAAVVAAADPAGGRRLVAAVTGSDGLSASTLRAFLRESLPEALVPSVILLLEELPRTANRKIDRRAVARLATDPAALASALADGGPDSREARVPADPVRELLAEIWSAVLNVPVERIRPQDDFFDLSGHSLLAAQVAHRVRQVFGVELPLRRLFEGATLAELAREITRQMEAGDAAEAPALPPLEPVPREAGGLLPTAYFQEWFWRLQGGPVGSQLNMAMALRIRGPFDLDVLRRVLTEIGRRHESLRATFHEVDGAILQRIGPPSEMPVPVVDLRGLPEDARERTVRALVAEDSARPFDLARGPLWTARLLELDGRHPRHPERVLLFNMHHAVSDGWSIEVLQGEIGALYAAFAEGRPSPLPPLSLQYPDFGAWQRRLFAEGLLQGQIDWWRRHLEGRPPVFALPADQPLERRQAPGASAATSGRLTLSAELSHRLREAARRESCTLPMLLFAGLSALLHRYSGQNELVLGSVSAGRNRAELSPLIGMFMTHLPLRVDLAGSPPFRDLLARVRDEVLAAYAHQDVPLPRLLEELFPGQATHRQMLFRILFNLLSFPVGAAEPPVGQEPAEDLEIEVVDLHTGQARYDLVIEYFDSHEQVACRFNAAAGRISPQGLAAFARDYESLLTQALEDLATPLDRLLPAPEYRPLPETPE